MRVSKGLHIASLLLIVSCSADALAQSACPAGTASEKPRELDRLDRYNEYDEYKAMLEEVLKRVGTLRIQVEPAGAEVLIDGKSEGKAPLEEPSFVEPGKHTIEVKLDGYKPAQVVVDMAVGAEFAVLHAVVERSRRSTQG